MGVSGSGKTTLLNCIATIDKLTTGHIIINNNDIEKRVKDIAKKLDISNIINKYPYQLSKEQLLPSNYNEYNNYVYNLYMLLFSNICRK